MSPVIGEAFESIPDTPLQGNLAQDLLSKLKIDLTEKRLPSQGTSAQYHLSWRTQANGDERGRTCLSSSKYLEEIQPMLDQSLLEKYVAIRGVTHEPTD